MLIHLDPAAVADAVGGGGTSAQSRRCCENLLRAHHEGHHVVSIAPEDVARFARILPHLSETARNVLDRLLATALEIEGLRDRLTCYLEAGISAAHDGSVHPRADGGQIILVHLHYFERSVHVLPAVLLGENGVDADFYRALGRLALATQGWGNIQLACHTQGAGGSQFAAEFTRLAERGQIILAIADSDQMSHDGAVGSTWNGLRKVQEGRPGFQRARVLHVRGQRTWSRSTPIGPYSSITTTARPISPC
jgi:hypothetical protein